MMLSPNHPVEKRRVSAGFSVVDAQAYHRSSLQHQKKKLWLFNIAMEAMAHRNRWFTELKNGWIFPVRYVSHNQMVYTHIGT